MPLGKLTEKEIDTLILVSQGKSVDDVANDRCVEPTTIRFQLQSARKKLRVHTTIEAVRRAVKLNLIPNPQAKKPESVAVDWSA